VKDNKGTGTKKTGNGRENHVKRQRKKEKRRMIIAKP